MEIFIMVFAVFALIIGSVGCFVGYKSIKVVPALLGFIAGASLGVAVGIMIQNIVIGIILLFSIGIVTSLTVYIWRSFGIMCISAFFGFTAGTLLFGNIIPGLVSGLFCLIFTMFFYKLGSVISSALYGSALIIYSAFIIIGNDGVPESIFTMAFIIWIFASLAGSTCQILTTFNDDFYPSNIIGSIIEYTHADAVAERKYPGFQKAYRNYCIKCGYDIAGLGVKCPRCGFDFNE